MFLCASVLVMIITIHRGYRRGITRELRSFVNVLIASICSILILVLKHAIGNRTYGTAIVVVIGLVILGFGWRLIRLVSGPLIGFTEIGIIRAIDVFFGVIFGAAEGVLIVFVAYKILQAAGLITDIDGIIQTVKDSLSSIYN